MKKIFLHTGIAAMMALGLWACNKDDDGVNSDATPIIRYVRPTAAEAADSLLTQGFMGDWVAIIGDNLAGVCEVWFNDRRATTLNPNLITNHAVIVSIPTEMYEEQSDLIRVVTRKGKEAAHAFVTVPAPPAPQSMSPEYARANDEVIITGKNFYGTKEEIHVFFPGGVEAEVVSVTPPTQIVAKVPAEAANTKGRLSVETAFGSGRSTFIYRDDRGMIFNCDDYPIVDCWGSLSSAAEFLSDALSVSGSYLKIAGTIDNAGAQGQKDEFDVYYWQNAGDVNYFNPYTGSLVPGKDPAKYQLRFELNIPAEHPWEALAMQFMFAKAGSTNSPIWNDDGYPKGLYMPWTKTGSFDTGGKWITVSLPLQDFHYDSYGKDVKKIPAVWEDFTIFFYRGGVEGTVCSPEFLVDNFRIVPIE
jgi:hypothetical protein